MIQKHFDSIRSINAQIYIQLLKKWEGEVKKTH